jgi:hypothetical protein
MEVGKIEKNKTGGAQAKKSRFTRLFFSFFWRIIIVLGKLQ